MRVWLVAFGWLLSAADARATTYTFESRPFSEAVLTPFVSPCAAGTCADYGAAMKVSGWFTTAAPLPANHAADISALVTSFRFSDGLHTFASHDPNLRRVILSAETDESGRVVAAGATEVRLQLWLAGSAPHRVTDRLAALAIGGVQDAVHHNLTCPQVVAEPSMAGDGDFCLEGGVSDRSTSHVVGTVGTWSMSSEQAASRPPWALLALAALLSSLGGWLFGRRLNASR